LLKQEPGLLPRLVNQYARTFDYYETEANTHYQRRLFASVKKLKKNQLRPVITEYKNGIEIQAPNYIVNVMFFPVRGEYRVIIRGLGEEAYEDLVSLAGVEGSAWDEFKEEVERGYESYRRDEPFRRISGINYRESDKGKKGDEETKKGKKPKYTSWE
jgi:hypothetical protein